MEKMPTGSVGRVWSLSSLHIRLSIDPLISQALDPQVLSTYHIEKKP